MAKSKALRAQQKRQERLRREAKAAEQRRLLTEAMRVFEPQLEPEVKPLSGVGLEQLGQALDEGRLGFMRCKNGRYIAEHGLVSRRGLRRVQRDDSGMNGFDASGKKDLVEEAAKKVLRGRNATVFEGRVLNVLRGKPQQTIKELASQFDTTPKQIYKAAERALAQVQAELKAPRERRNGSGEKCRLCGRRFGVYELWPEEVCKRGYNYRLRDDYPGGHDAAYWAGVPLSCFPQSERDAVIEERARRDASWRRDMERWRREQEQVRCEQEQLRREREEYVASLSPDEREAMARCRSRGAAKV